MTTDYAGGRTFDMGRVIGRAFEAIRANGLILVPISIVLVGGPQVLSAVLSSGGGFGSDWSAMAGFGLLNFVLTLVGATIMQGATTHVVVEALRGRKPTFGDTLSAALRAFWVLLGLGLVVGLAIGLGMILLLVPGIIIALMWCIVGPVAVAEGVGVGRALERSRDLTRNHRWVIFGLWVLYFIASVLFGAVIGGIGGGAIGAVGGAGAATTALSTVVLPILQAVFSIIGSAGVAALYVELRTIKEGGDERNVAAIFD